MFSKKYTINISTTYLHMLVQILMPLILLPYMVGKLEEDLYGLWVIFHTIIGYLGLTGFGFGTTFIKEVSKNNSLYQINKYLSSTLSFYILMSGLSFLIFLYLFLHIDAVFLIQGELISEANIAFSIFFLAFLVNFISSLFGALLFAKGILHIQNYIAIAHGIASTVLMFLALYHGYMLITLALINLIMGIITAIVIYYNASKYVSFSISLKYLDISLLKEMAIPSLHYFVITASAMIILNSDNLIISSFVGVGSVTLYAIGYKLVDVSQKLLFKVVDIMIPDIAQLDAKGMYKEILNLHNKSLLVSFLLGIVGYGFLLIYGSSILEWWVGVKYSIDKDILTVFIIFGILHIGVHVSAIFIVAMGLHRETSYMSMLDAIFNILFSIILLQFYGLLGVALGTLFAHMLTSAWFTNWWFYKNIHMKIKNQNGQSRRLYT